MALSFLQLLLLISLINLLTTPVLPWALSNNVIGILGNFINLVSAFHDGCYLSFDFLSRGANHPYDPWGIKCTTYVLIRSFALPLLTFRQHITITLRTAP